MSSTHYWRIFYLLMIILALSSGAVAQAGDWEAVRALAPGTQISIKTRLRNSCKFERATDTTLVCDPELPGFTHLTFNRKRIRQVRLEHHDDTNTAIGIGVGAGIGAAVGASGRDRGGSAIVGAVGGALIGGFFNRAFPITHRRVIYKR